MLRTATVHSLILLAALFLTLLWVNNPLLADYSLQLTAALVIFMVLSHKIFKTSFILTESIISAISVVLIVSATGGFSSPFFFLNYFLLFELSLLLEQEITVSATLALMVFYLYSHQLGSNMNNLVILISFIFMTPLAYLTGNIYQRLKFQKKIEI